MVEPEPPAKAQTDRFVLPETTFLAAIGCLDLIATVYLLATHRAQEANPLAAGILQRHGPYGFALFKACLLGGPLVIAELARKRHPVFVRKALRIGIGVYLALLATAYLPLVLRCLPH